MKSKHLVEEFGRVWIRLYYIWSDQLIGSGVDKGLDLI